MKKQLLLLLLLSSLISVSKGQQIFGRLTDTLNFKPLAYSSVSLIRLRDSVLIARQWADQQNGFRFSKLPKDTFWLQITRPGFADFDDKIILGDKDIDLGAIPLIAKANLLREVVIREKLDAIRLKGDTTEFLADSFQVKQGATVEDLLKKLPGIQVDRTGKITAQGETVQKVLVDGEEFFGDDPTVATRNLKAENVESVQVFDRKSETTLQTGVDDGEKTKTINLKLKEDAKKGYFGKAAAGLGTQVEKKNRYELDGMVNAFKNKRKISAFGAAANTNKTNLNWEDREKYAGNNNEVIFDEESGGMYQFYDNDESDLRFDGKGIPRTWYTGAHYSNKFKQDKIGVNANITRRQLRVGGFDTTYTEYILPDTLYYDRQARLFDNTQQATKGGITIDAKPDSLTTLRFKSNFTETKSTVFNVFNSSNLNGNQQLVNSNSRNQNNESSTLGIDNFLSINKKFAKQGRSANLAIEQKNTTNTGDGFLRSVSNFYDGNQAILLTDTIDQQKVNRSETSILGAKLAYTEPLSKTWFLVSDYNINYTSSSSKRSTFAKTQETYSNFIDSLSSDFLYDIWAHQTGLTFRRVTKKLNYSFGARMAYTVLDQDDRLAKRSLNRNFTNFFPAASVNYKLNSTTSFGVNYSGRTEQPSLNAIQPLRDNTNPLNLYVGNDALKQSFEHSISLRYNAFKPISGRGIFANFNYSYTSNDFSSSNFVDNQGRRVYQTINVDGNQNISSYLYYYLSLKKFNINTNFNLGLNSSRVKNKVNFEDNVNSNNSINFGFYPGYNNDKWLECGLNFNWNFTRSTSSLRPDVVTDFWVNSYSPWINLNFDFGLEVNTDIEFNRRQSAYDSQANLNTAIWNAQVNYKFLKNKQMMVSLNAYDILNQNIGFSRYAASNFVSQNVYSNLRRYVLFTLTYFINNGGNTND